MKQHVQKLQELRTEGDAFTYENFCKQGQFGYPASLVPRWSAWAGEVEHYVVRVCGAPSPAYEMVTNSKRVVLIGNGQDKFNQARSLLMGAIEFALRIAPSAGCSNAGSRIFIGHGRSSAWKDIADFLTRRLGLEWDEFNRESVAGVPTTERLKQMLDDAAFALLIMTAEDQHSDGSSHARENVIHEAGLFQGRLGFRRAVVLLEEGCVEFSNIAGLGQIRFPRGDVLARSEQIRQVLEREGVAVRSQ